MFLIQAFKYKYLVCLKHYMHFAINIEQTILKLKDDCKTIKLQNEISKINYRILMPFREV